MTLSRRDFVGRAALLAATTLAPLQRVVPATAAAPDAVIAETLDGVVAYVVPGADRFSAAQAVSTARPGGVAARGGEALRATLDVAGPGTVDAAVSILNGLASAVDPGAGERAARLGFAAPFPALAFDAKDEVFARLSRSSEDAIRRLGAILPAIAAFVSYSEYGAAGRPVGWRLTGYDGVADGRDELRGYYGGRRRARA